MSNFIQISTILALALVAWLCLRNCAWRNYKTPEEYRANYKVSPVKYCEDKAALTDKLYQLIREKAEAFYTKQHDSLTKVYIDTILYNSERDKVAFLVLVENSKSKIIIPQNEIKYDSSRIHYDTSGFYYDGHCFTAKYINNSWDNVKWIMLLNIIDYPNIEEASIAIRNQYFIEISEIKGYYNIDDIRFWEKTGKLNQPTIYQKPE